MVHTDIVIGALAIAATAISTPQPAVALGLRGGQTELINRPDMRSQHCWADGYSHWRRCESNGLN